MIFKEFPKLFRFSREIVITEKIDGTNASIFIQNEALEEEGDSKIIAKTDGYTMRAGSRTRWIIPQDDNYGFANWAKSNSDELFKLGEGHHFGEWWGSGIQRSYGLQKGEKRFSLFNTSRWKLDSFDELGYQQPPKCCHIVPILWKGMMNTVEVDRVLAELVISGSIASPGFMKPEGIVVFHTAANQAFKKTIDKDDKHKFEK